MDMRSGEIYGSLKEARKAGVPDQFLVSGTEEALKNLKKIIFTKGSFKNVTPTGEAVYEPVGKDK
jgi:hypothetical protein